MQVETYEVERQSNEIAQLAADGEAAMLIEKLGLVGQQKTISEDGTHMPYRPMTKVEGAVFGALFPRRSKVEDFSDGPIPVRVLQVIAHCRELNLPALAYLEVWYSENSKEDPVLVGRSNSYSGTNYLLARWGDSLFPFEKMLADAIKKVRVRAKSELQKLKREIETALTCVDDLVEAEMQDGNIYHPHAYI